MQHVQLSVESCDHKTSPWHSVQRMLTAVSPGKFSPQLLHVVQAPREGCNCRQFGQRTEGLPPNQGKVVAQGRSKQQASEEPFPLMAWTAIGSSGRSARSAAHITSCCVGASSTRTKWDWSCGTVAMSTQSRGSPAFEKCLGPQISYFSTGLAGSCVSGTSQEISYFLDPEPAARQRGWPAGLGAAGTCAQSSCEWRRSSSLAACTRWRASAPNSWVALSKRCSLSGCSSRTRRFHAFPTISSLLASSASTPRSSSGVSAIIMRSISASASRRDAGGGPRGATGTRRGCGGSATACAPLQVRASASEDGGDRRARFFTQVSPCSP
mmetsp:Transcript_79583/g.170644  ORF Transcript_79583/g.170644 Transcript_79583/m.170644 type:complete len:325 (+) Transcript_79583:325-1299(+)